MLDDSIQKTTVTLQAVLAVRQENQARNHHMLQIGAPRVELIYYTLNPTTRRKFHGLLRPGDDFTGREAPSVPCTPDCQPHL